MALILFLEQLPLLVVVVEAAMILLLWQMAKLVALAVVVEWCQPLLELLVLELLTRVEVEELLLHTIFHKSRELAVVEVQVFQY
jgi:hypothetical protein